MGEEKTTGALGGADRALLYGTVATTGAAVMMLELLGTRIIGPFYGVSLYVCVVVAYFSRADRVVFGLLSGRRDRGPRDGFPSVLRHCVGRIDRGAHSLYQSSGLACLLYTSDAADE